MSIMWCKWKVKIFKTTIIFFQRKLKIKEEDKKRIEEKSEKKYDVRA